MRHEDGTRTEYRRSNDEKTLVKRRLSDLRGGKEAIITTTVYRMDKRGNPLSCKIADGKGNELYKVAYGYHKETGQLVAEDMFDVRVPQRDPRTGKETPIRRIYWRYDANGNATFPISFVFRKGKYAEEVFDKSKSTFPSDNPFKNENATAPSSSKNDDFDAPPLPPLPFER